MPLDVATFPIMTFVFLFLARLRFPTEDSIIKNLRRQYSAVDSLYLDYSLSRTSLYFEQKARSLGHLWILQAIFISLSRTSLSRIFLYFEQKSCSLLTIFLSISNFFYLHSKQNENVRSLKILM